MLNPMVPASPAGSAFKGWLELSKSTLTFHLQGEDHAEHKHLVMQLLLSPSVGTPEGTFRFRSQSPDGSIQAYDLEAVDPGHLLTGFLTDFKTPFLDQISGVRVMFGVLSMPDDRPPQGLLHRLSVQIGDSWIETFGTPFTPEERKRANRALRSAKRSGTTLN